MVSVELTNKGRRCSLLADENQTIMSFLEANGVDISITPPALNGSMLDSDELQRTFSDLGITTSCLLTCIVKTSNA